MDNLVIIGVILAVIVLITIAGYFLSLVREEAENQAKTDKEREEK